MKEIWLDNKNHNYNLELKVTYLKFFQCDMFELQAFYLCKPRSWQI